MSYEELKHHVLQYFGDTSRSPAETKADMLSLADACRDLAETIQDEH